MLALALALLAFAPESTPELELPSKPTPAPIPRPNGGYIHLSPGFLGFTPVAHATPPMWTVGAAVGWHRSPRRLGTQVGLFFDDHFLLQDPRAHELHTGLEVRVGVMDRGRPTVFAYGLGRIGCVISYFNDPPWVWMAGMIGGGGQIFFARHLSVGLEVGLGLGGEAWIQLRGRGFVGVWF